MVDNATKTKMAIQRRVVGKNAKGYKYRPLAKTPRSHNTKNDSAGKSQYKSKKSSKTTSMELINKSKKSTSGTGPLHIVIHLMYLTPPHGEALPLDLGAPRIL